MDYTKEYLKYKRNKKLKGIFIGIGILLVAIIGSTYAFFTYSKSLQAFTLTSSGITASFSSGSNQINITNGYPISDQFAIQNLDKLDYIDFNISGNVEDESQGLTYEIYLTEKDGNTLDLNYIKVYITDENGEKLKDPRIYNSLDYTTYSKDASTGKLIYKLEGIPGNYSKSFRIYAWIDKDYEQNEVSQEFSFYVNLYAYNDTNKLGSYLIKKAALARANDGSNCLTTVEEDGITYISGTKDCIDFNYVWYSGKLWRITAIYPDGRMKMITEDPITTIFWGSTVEYNGSWIYQWLNEDFYDTLVSPENVLIENAEWNYSTDENSTPVKPTTIATQKTVNENVGSLNAYEYYKSYQNTTYGNGYLNIGYYWWLITPYSSSTVRYVGGTGTFNGYLNSTSPSWNSYGVRPSIILQSGISLSGSGIKADPYKISGDKEAATAGTTLLNTRVSGEYVTFKDELYRIVGIENNTTKIVKVDYIRDGNNVVVNKKFASSATFGKITNTKTDDYWDYYLNNTWLKDKFEIQEDDENPEDTYDTLLEKGTYYLGEYRDDASYKKTICSDSNNTGYIKPINGENACERVNNTYTGYVGLLRVGEMFSSQLGSGYNNSSSMWLITPNSSYVVRYVLNYDSLYFDSSMLDAFAVHPSLHLKSTIVIKGGDGTLEHPFEIE